MKNKLFLLLSLLVITLASCHRVRPQAPANQPREDSAAIALVEMNYRLTQEADRILIDSVKASKHNFALSEFNFWFARLENSDGKEVKKDDEVYYEAQIYDLATGNLIEDSAAYTKVGSREVLLAMDLAFTFMHVGERLELLVPFYAAYGKEGAQGVAPLTNVKIILKINNIR